MKTTPNAILNLELLAQAIVDGMCYHLFKDGQYAGRSFYYPSSASSFQLKNPGFTVKYLTNQQAERNVA